MATQEDKAPEVRPRRPVYRSYGELIRVLVTDAQARVKMDRTKHEIPPLVITHAMRVIAVRILAFRKALKANERTLSDKYKACVPDRYDREDRKVPVEYTYMERHRLEEQRPAAMTARLDAIKRLRVKATLDTMDLTPKQAKAYLLNLERQLSKI